MAFTYGTTNVKIFNVSSIEFNYIEDGGGVEVETILPEKVENGVTVQGSVGNTVNLCNGAEVPRSEKGMVSFVLMGTATEHLLWKSICNIDGKICVSFTSMVITLTDGSTITITGQPHAEFASKGGEINKLTVSMEVNAKDADDIIVWEAGS